MKIYSQTEQLTLLALLAELRKKKYITEGIERAGVTSGTNTGPCYPWP